MHRPILIVLLLLHATAASFAQDKITAMTPAELKQVEVYWRTFSPYPGNKRWRCWALVRNNTKLEIESLTFQLCIYDKTNTKLIYSKPLKWTEFTNRGTGMAGNLKPNHQDSTFADVSSDPSFAGAPYWFQLTGGRAYRSVANPKSPSHFFASIARADLATVKRLVDKDPSLANLKDPSGHSTAMHEAAWQGDLAMFKYLHSKGGDIKRANKEGMSSFHVAAASWSHDVLRYLLSKGIKPDETTSDGYTALSLAAMNCSVECVKVLLKARAKVNKRMPNGSTALYQAVYDKVSTGIYQKESDEVIRLLIKAGADVRAYDKKGIPPLGVAAAQNNPRAIRVLVQQKADVNQANPPHKWTPVFYAVNTGSYPALRELLALGADPLKKDSRGKTAYDLALALKRTDCASLLKDAMAARKRRR